MLFKFPIELYEIDKFLPEYDGVSAAISAGLSSRSVASTGIVPTAIKTVPGQKIALAIASALAGAFGNWRIQHRARYASALK